jgi:LCP family protein required for cell wall assembly
MRHLRDEQHSTTRSKKKKRLKTWQKALIGVGIPAVLALAIGLALFAFVRSVDAKLAIDTGELSALKESLAPRSTDPQEPYYILVLGSDAREGDTASRSDTIMLCRLDPKAKIVSILSIPRDTKIELEGYGTQKINAAMAYGGLAGAVSAVSSFVGVDISHAALINFEGLAAIVDALGGVTVNVPYYTSFEGIELQPGEQTLNGAQALAFVRCRYDYALGDFQRAANQRSLLRAVAKRITQAPASEIPGLVSSLAECASTDLTATQLADMALMFQGMNTDTNMYTGQVPSSTGTIDEVSYVLVDEEKWAVVRERYVSGTVPFVDAEDQPAVID